MSNISYNDWLSMTDKKLCETIGTFIKHQRINQNKSQTEVALAAGISRSTMSLLERGENISISSLIQVLRVLDLLYIMNVFQIETEVSPIEYAKLQKNKRKRAGKKKEVGNKIKEDIGW